MSRWTSESLADTHVIESFDPGKPELDVWLKQSAAHAAGMRTARTFVWHGGDNAVVAYFSLAAHLVTRNTLPRKIARGSPDAIPAILLAKLALDRTLQGQGLGGELLWDALSRAVAASDIAAARVVVVDAIDEDAARFYGHYGFVAVPRNTCRLVQKTSDIAAALAASR
ncbi:MAG: GNAT family N-acetyltransferase [Myxococcales bacterium]|nr:GNAT family N-acetyltransferase [Myxococcales bacterium]